VLNEVTWRAIAFAAGLGQLIYLWATVGDRRGGETYRWSFSWPFVAYSGIRRPKPTAASSVRRAR